MAKPAPTATETNLEQEAEAELPPLSPKEEAWLEHTATPEQLQFFSDNGFLVVENALEGDMLERVIDVVDQVTAAVREKQGESLKKIEKNAALQSNKTYATPRRPGDVGSTRCVMEGPTMLELLDYKTTFPLLWDIMGWNIQNYMSVISVKPPEEKPEDEEVNPTSRVNGSSGYHQDGGRPNPEMAWDHAAPELVPGDRQPPMLSLKVAYFLTDTRVPECGAMKCVPGSHQSEVRPGDTEDPIKARSKDVGMWEPPGAIDLAVPAGTAVLFDRRTWHSAARNFSDVTRKVIFMGYSYRWLRGHDYSLYPDWLLDKADPIQRQLLGDSAKVGGHWQPSEFDVPLKGFLDRARGQGAYAVKSPLVFPHTGEQVGTNAQLERGPLTQAWGDAVPAKL